MSRASIRDRVLGFRDVPTLRNLLVGVVDRLQDLPPQHQIIAPALTFYCFCKGVGINPIDVLILLERMEKDVDGPFSNQWAAMKAYAAGELNQ